MITQKDHGLIYKCTRCGTKSVLLVTLDGIVNLKGLDIIDDVGRLYICETCGKVLSLFDHVQIAVKIKEIKRNIKQYSTQFKIDPLFSDKFYWCEE